jgi:hypothetical protein
MKHIVKQVLFAGALALAGASAAQAFTYESAAPGDGSAGRNYLDPQDQIKPQAGNPQRFDQGQSSDSQKGGLFLNFGSGQLQSFDKKYNSNDYFDPLKR